MKKLMLAVLLMGFGSYNAAIAAEPVVDSTGKEKIGVVSTSNAYSLDDLSEALSHEASEKGATSYKIISTSGDNRMHGVAEIYR